MSQEKTKCSIPQKRSDIIREARQWVGTPYHHQSYIKYVGCDCVGLIVGAGRNSGVLDITDKEIQSFAGYGRVPNTDRMRFHMRRFLVETDDPQVGDIAWIEWISGLPMHLAILSEYNGRQTIIHSFRDAGKVVEHTLSRIWKHKIHSYWRYPKVI